MATFLKVVYFSVISTIIFFCLLMIIFSFVFLSFSDYALNESNFIANNWSKPLILDIKIVSGSCPYRYEALQIGSTPQIAGGFYTSWGDLITKPNFNIKPSDYSRYMDYKKFYIPNVDPAPIYSWRKSVICVLRSNIVNINTIEGADISTFNNVYHNLNYVQAYENCGPGLQKCPHPLDTLNNFMCVLDLFECGINYLEVVDAPPTNYDKTKYNFLRFLDGKKWLAIGRNLPNNYPIVDFKLKKGEFCSYPLESSLNTTYYYDTTFNWANKCNSKINGYSNYPFATKLDSDSQTNVFNSLSVYSQYSNLPFVLSKLMDNLDYNLFYMNYVGFQKYCDFPKSISLTNDINSFRTGITWVLILCFSNIGILFIGGLFCCGYRCDDWDEEVRGLLKCHGCGILILFIPLFFLVWIYYSFYVNSATYKYLYDNWAKDESLKCFDGFHAKLLKYQNIQLAPYDTFYAIIAIFATMIIGLFVCYRSFAGVLKKYLRIRPL